MENPFNLFAYTIMFAKNKYYGSDSTYFFIMFQ